MKHRLLIAAAATALMAAPSLASAQDNKDDAGWYLRGNAGYGVHNDSDVFDTTITGLELPDTSIAEDVFLGNIESEGEFGFSLGAGYDFGNNWRLELDGISLITDTGAIGQQDATSSSIRTQGALLNILYDIPGFGRFEPYVGGGAGWIEHDATLLAHDFPSVDNVGVINPACFGGGVTRVSGQALTCLVNDTDANLGWQLLAGLGFALTDNLTWDTQYRYFDTGVGEFNGSVVNGVTQEQDPLEVELRGIGGHMLLSGLRYRFGEATLAPPPPPPPPAPVADYTCWNGDVVFNVGQCPAQPAPVATVTCWDGSSAFTQGECPAQPLPQTYTCWDGSLVYDLNTCPAQVVTRSNETVASLCGNQFRQEIIYYEFNKGQSAETRNTINRILDVGEFCNVNNIRVIGHTDTSGSAAYNLALSKRRAADAREELVRQGINQAVITSEGKGETEPFVDTGDGVKEQLNRRTEVLITLSEIGGIN